MVYIPDKLASSLSDSLIGSLTMGSNEDKDGDYDFSVLGWTLQDFNKKKKNCKQCLYSFCSSRI